VHVAPREGWAVAECFCGCGRTVGLGSWGINKRGKRTVGLLAKLHESRQMVERDDPLAEPTQLVWLAIGWWESEGDRDAVRRDSTALIVGYLEGLIEEGEVFERFWMSAVHGGDLPPPSEPRSRFYAHARRAEVALRELSRKRIKKRWKWWGEKVMMTLSDVGLPAERGVRAAMRGDV
jgi:hypothetical protein